MKNLFRCLDILLASLCQPNWLTGAVKQGRADLLLDLMDHHTQRGLRNNQLLSRSGDTAFPVYSIDQILTVKVIVHGIHNPLRVFQY